MFENREVSLDELPSMDEPEWHPLDKRLARLMLVRSGIALIFVCLVVAAIQVVAGYAAAQNAAEINLAWLWIFPAVLAIPALSWPRIAVPRKGYVVRDKDIVFQTGVLLRTVTAIPYNRIQHVEKDSAPLDRRFEIANLKIFTAGGSGGDLKIDGLPADDAERLRIHILDKVGAAVERH
jgi:membrane protein YdbS with pleckstrin-like domain